MLRKGSVSISQSRPDIATQWDYQYNEHHHSGLSPNTVSMGSNKKIGWVCNKDHTWVQTPYNRKTLGCPVCAGKKCLPGYNDVATTHPDILADWDSDGDGASPYEVTYGSDKKIPWKCQLGHKWSRAPYMKKGCPTCDGKVILPGFNDLGTTRPDIAAQWDYKANYPLTPQEVMKGTNKKCWWICPVDDTHRWKCSPNDRNDGHGCPECANTVHSSLGERQILHFLNDLLGREKVKACNRSLVNPYEIDIYIPEHHLAIEVNGLYWHSINSGKTPDYHYDKWRRCADQGVQLITIWEDTWRDHSDLVKEMLTHKVGRSSRGRIGARETTVSEVSVREAREFCDTHHIQGFTSGSAYIGLYDLQGSLVAVSIWRKNKNDLILSRYCTSLSVPGGMGRLLARGLDYARDKGLTRIVTFADHEVSDGALYESLGFVNDGDIPPDYCYVRNLTGCKREHKFGYRLARFRSDPTLKWKEGLTERQLAELNHLFIIYDCGKTRYVMDV